MASNRARANSTLNTRLNDVYRRLNAQEAASRGTTESEAISSEEVSEQLDLFSSANYLLEFLAQAAPQLLAVGGKKISDWNEATTIGQYWADASALNAPVTGITVGIVYSYGPDGTNDRRMQEVFTPSNVAADQVKSWRRVSLTGDTGWTGWVEVSAGSGSTPVVAASETQAGIIELATTAEVQGGTDAVRAVTPAGLASRTATETRTGVVELATTAEATTGTDTARAVTPAGVKAVADTKAPLSHTHPWSQITGTPEAWPVIASRDASASYSTYPMGTSVMFNNNGAGWPAVYGTVRTDRSYASGGGTIQYWSGYNTNLGELWMRQWAYLATDWSPWQRLDRLPTATTLQAQLNPGPTETVMTPARVKDAIDTFAPVAGRGQTSMTTTNWNTATKTGFYTSISGSGSGVSNYPPGTDFNVYSGWVSNDSTVGISSGNDAAVLQEVWEYEAVFPSSFSLVRKWYRGGMPTSTPGTYTWTAWQSSDATETRRGLVEMATTAEATTGTDTARAVTPAGVKAAITAAATPVASETVQGKVELATVAEATAGTDTTRAVTPAGLAGALSTVTIPAASETVQGKVELATAAEVQAGTDTTRAVTPAGVASLPGYRYMQTVTYTSSGTFTKDSYPGMRAIRIRLVGGGGAGAGAAAGGSSTHTGGGGGGGGGYAEDFALASSLAASETVTVGVGATGGTGNGATGGTSSFGTLASATGGAGGTTAAASALYITALGGAGGVGTAGDLLSSGDSGGSGGGNATLGQGGNGGGSALGGGAVGTYTGAGSGSLPGNPGGNYGGGGGGAMSNSSGVARAGGNGAPGIVIVEVYA